MLRSPEKAPLLESADRGFRMAVVKNTLRSKTGWSCHGMKKKLKVSGEKKLRGNQTEIVEWKIRNSLAEQRQQTPKGQQVSDPSNREKTRK